MAMKRQCAHERLRAQRCVVSIIWFGERESREATIIAEFHNFVRMLLELRKAIQKIYEINHR